MHPVRAVMRHVRATAWILLLAFTTTACSSGVVQSKFTPSPETYAARAEQNGLFIAAKPLTHSADLSEAFRSDITADNVLPIFVVAENRHTTASFVLDKSKISVVNMSTRTTLDRPDLKDVSSGAAGNAMLGVGPILVLLAGVIPGLIVISIGWKLFADARQAQQNIWDQELTSRTLAPGQTAQGFVYVSMPSDQVRAGRYELVIDALDPDTATATRVSLPIDSLQR